MNTIIAVVSTAIVCTSIYIYLVQRYHKHEARLMVDVLDSILLNANDYENWVQTTTEKKGLKYSIYLFGRIYKLLKDAGKKDKNICVISDALEKFLQTVMAEDIKQYKSNREKKEQKVTDAMNS